MIKTVFKYILILVVLPCLWALMLTYLPLFLLMAPLGITLKIMSLFLSQPEDVELVFVCVYYAIFSGALGFSMGWLISTLAKNKERVMVLLGGLIAGTIYLVNNFHVYKRMNSIFCGCHPENYWIDFFAETSTTEITLLASALLGAWLVIKKRRANPSQIPDNNIHL